MKPKTQESSFRLPEWLGDGTRRWRMRVGYQFGKNGRRVEKPFYWSRPDNSGGVPPPDVQAEAVEHQLRWRQLSRDWKALSSSLKFCFPERDWSMPVWCDEEQAKMSSGEAAGLAQAMATATSEIESEELNDEQLAVRWVSRNGLEALIASLRQPVTLSKDFQFAVPAYLERASKKIEEGRITAMTGLAPTVRRKLVSSVTLRDAAQVYLAALARRVTLKTTRGIDKTTSDTAARRLYGAFGLSANPEKPPLRKTPVDIDAPLLSLDTRTLEEFSHFWHGMPAGVGSERTVKNHLEAVRQFLVWCEEQLEYGWHLPAASRRLLTAGDRVREAVAFDPANLRKLVAAGGRRGQVLVLFGLCCGYYPADIAEALATDFFEIGGTRYVQRFRSKERKSKRGRRPLKVRHHVAPEFADLIDAERGANASGTLFNTERGTTLTAASINDRWQDVQERAGVDLMFSQLRKLGYNAIKRLGKREGVQMAEFWDGHAKGTSDSYDDGVWPELNEVERLWADELRTHAILT
jgi:hypothetical protein